MLGLHISFRKFLQYATGEALLGEQVGKKQPNSFYSFPRNNSIKLKHEFCYVQILLCCK
jgi:hypothetical protein